MAILPTTYYVLLLPLLLPTATTTIISFVFLFFARRHCDGCDGRFHAGCCVGRGRDRGTGCAAVVMARWS